MGEGVWVWVGWECQTFCFLCVSCGTSSFLIDAFDYRDMAEDQVSKSTAALKQPHLMGLC